MTPLRPARRLSFALDKVLAAAEDASAATAYSTFYDTPPPGPCLVFTAQYGIYLMSNALRPEGTESVRTFADGWGENTDPTHFLNCGGILDYLPLNDPEWGDINGAGDDNTLLDALRAATAHGDTLITLHITPDDESNDQDQEDGGGFWLAMTTS